MLYINSEGWGLCCSCYISLSPSWWLRTVDFNNLTMFVLQMRLKPQQPLLTGNKQTWIESAGIYFLETALQNNARLHGLWGSSLSFYTPPGMFKGLSEFPRYRVAYNAVEHTRHSKIFSWKWQAKQFHCFCFVMNFWMIFLVGRKLKHHFPYKPRVVLQLALWLRTPKRLSL